MRGSGLAVFVQYGTLLRVQKLMCVFDVLDIARMVVQYTGCGAVVQVLDPVLTNFHFARADRARM